MAERLIGSDASDPLDRDDEDRPLAADAFDDDPWSLWEEMLNALSGEEGEPVRAAGVMGEKVATEAEEARGELVMPVALRKTAPPAGRHAQGLR